MQGVPLTPCRWRKRRPVGIPGKCPLTRVFSPGSDSTRSVRPSLWPMAHRARPLVGCGGTTATVAVDVTPTQRDDAAQHPQDDRLARRPRRPHGRHRLALRPGRRRDRPRARPRHRRLVVLEERQAGHPGRPRRPRRRGPVPRVLRHRARAHERAGMPMPRLYISPRAPAERLRHRSQPRTTPPWPSPRACSPSAPGTRSGACSPTSCPTSRNRDILIGSVAAGGGHRHLLRRQHGDVGRHVRRRAGRRRGRQPDRAARHRAPGADRRRAAADGARPAAASSRPTAAGPSSSARRAAGPGAREARGRRPAGADGHRARPGPGTTS